MQRTCVGFVFLVSTICVQAQTLSPRELFYGEARAQAAPKPAAVKAKASLPKPKPPEPDAAAPAAPAEVAASVPSSDSAPVMSLGSPQDHVASLVAVKTGPLGLKYSVLKRGPGGEFEEVDKDSNFTAGDHIRVGVEVNDSGYLYVVAQGSSGIWTVMFPTAEFDGGDNRVRPEQQYNIPKTSFLFDSRPGTEKLFVILSRQPEQDLESLIYALRDKGSADHASKPGELSRSMMASSAPIQDDVVQRLRQAYSRDLVIEKVDDAKTPPPDEIRKIEVKHGATIPPGEKAFYVVNRNADANARVVADVELRHQ